MPKVVITDGERFPFEPEELQQLARANLDPLVIQAKAEQELLDLDADVMALIVFGTRITARVIQHFPQLKIIARCGIGVDNIAVEYARKQCVTVTTVPDYCLVDVADYVLMAMLLLSRQVAWLNQRVHLGFWDAYPIYQPLHRLEGQVLGLIGYGNLGQAVAQRTSFLKMNVLAYDPYLTPNDIPPARVSFVSLPRLLAESDFISLHVPLTVGTRNLLGAKEFAQMKSGTYLINTSRGGVINETALTDALIRGKVRGAVLDVLEHEPPDTVNPLFNNPNVIFTPHSAAHTEEALHEVKARAISSVIQTLNT